MMNEQTSFILIVEDDQDMADLNARLLKRHGYNTLVAYTAAQARSIIRENSPNVLILDIELPDGDGRSLCKEFRQYTDAPVMFLTGRTKKKDKLKGFNIGGDYYLTKPYDRDEFLVVVKSLFRRMEQTRKRLAEATVVTKGSLTLDIKEKAAYVNGRDAELTPKEFAVLLLLVQYENIELSCETIYKTVWKTIMNNDANAIRLHISRLKKKLNEENTDDFAILSSYGGGYTFTRT